MLSADNKSSILKNRKTVHVMARYTETLDFYKIMNYSKNCHIIHQNEQYCDKYLQLKSGLQ